MTAINFKTNRPAALASQALAATLLIVAAPAHAQVSISPGSTWALGGGTLDHGCTALQVGGTAQVDGGQWTGMTDVSLTTPSGTLHGGSGVLALSGQFGGGAGFVPGTGTVRMGDGCGSAGAGIGAATGFYTLEVATAQGRTLTLPAGAAVSIAHRLALTGAPGQLLRLRSSSPGQAAITALQPGASQSVAYVQVSDNHATAQPIAPGPAAQYQSVQGGNVQQWFAGAGNNPGSPGGAVPVPALGPWGVPVLGALLAGLAGWRRWGVALFLGSRRGQG